MHKFHQIRDHGQYLARECARFADAVRDSLAEGDPKLYLITTKPYFSRTVTAYYVVAGNQALAESKIYGDLVCCELITTKLIF